MKIYWGVIRIWYVSTTCKSNDISLQYYYMNGKGKSKVLIEFLLIFRQFGDVLFFFMLVGFADILRHSPSLWTDIPMVNLLLFSMRSAHRWLFQIEITIVQSSQDNQSLVPIWITKEEFFSPMRVDEFTKSTLSSDGVLT